MKDPKPLGRIEVWVAEHAVPIFAVLALSIILGAVAVFWMWHEQGQTADQVTVNTRKVTNVNKAICDQRSLTDSKRARGCAERIRIGLINCRRSTPCRAAYLALATYPPPAREVSSGSHGGGDAHQTPSKAHQQPGPGKGPPGGKHGSQPAPTPSPSPSQPAPAPSGPGNGPPAETPGNGPPAGAGGPGAAHTAVKACILEKTCIGLDVPLP